MISPLKSPIPMWIFGPEVWCRVPRLRLVRESTKELDAEAPWSRGQRCHGILNKRMGNTLNI